jgi:murein DD-endopeptidase MepM/ murein hydrolase activator NlpD
MVRRGGIPVPFRSNTLRFVLLSLLPMLLMFLPPVVAHAQGRIVLALPTSNHALLDGQDSLFYQATAGKHLEPWKSGMYGYVRNRRGTGDHAIFLRFHEGIDIKPLYRDARGVPLDSVRAIDDGRVVHVCAVAGHSNYGKYIVVRHIWNGAPYYSLYAHLNEVWIDAGAVVRRGEPLGRLGYTGDGINRARAHLHLEIGMLLNEHFGAWFAQAHPGVANQNGDFNGHNLVGLDVARLYRALRDDPSMTIESFLSGEEPFFELRLPLDARPDLLNRYPWLSSSVAGDSRSWSVLFTRAGLPLCINPSDEPVETPSVIRLDRTTTPCRYLARGRRSGAEARLSSSGQEYVDLLTATPETLFSLSEP